MDIANSFVGRHLENFKSLRELLGLGAELFERAQAVSAARIMPDRSVIRWLSSPQQRVLKAVIALLLASSLAKILLWIVGARLIASEMVRTFALSRGAIYAVEAVLLIVVVVYITGKEGRDDAATSNAVLRRGIRAENQFFGFWPYLWFSWFVLYVVLAYNSIHPLSSPFLSVGLNFVNNLSGLFIFALFYELSERTTHGPADGRRQHWLPLLMLLTLLAGAEALVYSLSSDEAVLKSAEYVFGLISGLLVGVFTGLLVARLTSRLFNLPIVALVVLTLFAVIQPVFPVLTARDDPTNSGIAYVAAFAALYAKIVLLVTIEWTRDKYGILYYMVYAARLFEEERERRMSESFQMMASALLEDASDTVSEPTGRKVTQRPS